jgi:3-dehydroquinate synthase
VSTAIHVPIHEARDASYDVIVGRGTLAELPGLVRQRCPAHRYAVIADHRVAELHGAALLDRLLGAGLETLLVQFPSGEWNKSRETWAELTDQLLKAPLGRDGAVIAFGGGVAGDLAGFVAATYLRGIPYVQVPTTLLAMIDSSVGGKTGVDVPAGKNLVGAFHQPRLVLADVELLGTLPRPQLAAGMAEAIKHSVIADAAALELLSDSAALLEKDLERLEAVVTRSVEIKAGVVSRDEKEHGLRQILNFGHTIGHAVEALTGFELLHGEAVAIGMAVESRIAETLGVAEQGTQRAIVELLERFDLPKNIPEPLATEDLLEQMRTDKKARQETVRFALLRRIGEMSRTAEGEWTTPVERRVIAEAIAASR